MEGEFYGAQGVLSVFDSIFAAECVKAEGKKVRRRFIPFTEIKSQEGEKKFLLDALDNDQTPGD